MGKKLRILIVAAVAATTLAAAFASSAAADVYVYPSQHLSIDESTLSLGTWSGGQPLTQVSCDYEGGTTGGSNVADDGSFSLELEAIGYCPNMEPCDNVEWPGQIVGPGDPGYLGVADFEAVMTGCVISGGSLSGVPFETRLHINGEGSNQEWTWPLQNIVVPGVGPINYWIASDPFNIDMHGMEVYLAE